MNGIFLSHDVIPKTILILTGAACLLFLLPRWMPALLALWGQHEGRLFLCLVTAQLISLALSTAFSSYPALSLGGTVWRRFGWFEQTAALIVATGIVSLAAARPNWIRHLLRAVIVCGGVAAFYGVMQYFGVDPFLWRDLYAVEFLGSVVRPPATMGHAIYFAAYLVPVALLATSSAGTEPQRNWKWIYGGIAILSCLAILLSGSRGAVLAVAGGGLLLAVRAKRGFSARVAIAAVLLAAIVAGLAVSPAGESFRLRLLQWRRDPGGTRVGVWRETPGLIVKHPWLGSGPETFAMEFRAIQSAALSRAYPDFYQETPHNAFLDAASAQGIPGALILVGVFAMGLLRSRGRQSGFEAALLGILIASMFASFTLVSSMYLWTLAGLGLVLSRDPFAGTRRVASFAGFAAGGLFLAAAVVFAVEDRAYADLQDAVDARNVAQAGKDYALATGIAVGMPGYELWSSREFATLHAWDKAATAASLAEERSEERFSAAYQSSVLAVAAGDLTRAESKAREAIRQAPNWYKPHLLLGQILQAMGRGSDAADQMRISRNLGWRGY
jgi:O-antigen ligase